MNAQNFDKKPVVKRETKNKIRVDFDRTPLKERLKAKSFRDVPVFGEPYSCVDFVIIDQVAKELLEESK